MSQELLNILITNVVNPVATVLAGIIAALLKNMAKYLEGK